MPFNFKKKKNQINTSPIDNSSSDNTSSTPDSTQSESDNSKFRKGFTAVGKSIRSGAKSMVAGSQKLQGTLTEFHNFCGGFSFISYPWLIPYFNKFHKFPNSSEYVIKHIGSDNGDIAVIYFQNNRVGEYNIKSGEFEKRSFQWLSDVNYDYTPPKEEAKASQDDSAQAESEDGQCIVVVPRGYRVSRGRIRKGGQTERKEGSDR